MTTSERPDEWRRPFWLMRILRTSMLHGGYLVVHRFPPIPKSAVKAWRLEKCARCYGCDGPPELWVVGAIKGRVPMA